MKELRFPPCGTYTPDEMAILRDVRITAERVLDEAFQVPTIAKLRANRYDATLNEIRHIASATKWHDTPDLRASLRMILDLCDGRDDSITAEEAERIDEHARHSEWLVDHNAR